MTLLISYAVMPGLVPGIHVVLSMPNDVDGRDKPGHDDLETDDPQTSIVICDGHDAYPGDGAPCVSQAAFFLAVISLRLISTSAIWIAFSAAPLRKLSDTHQKARPFSTVPSSRMRLM